MEDEAFDCWVCGCKISKMHEIAQGMCDNCKSAIIKKLDISPFISVKSWIRVHMHEEINVPRQKQIYKL